jgi:hypothetical protein
MAEPVDIHSHRRQLQAIAYRMLGSMAEAEDAVQETYLRWHRQDQAEQVSEIREPCRSRSSKSRPSNRWIAWSSPRPCRWRC